MLYGVPRASIGILLLSVALSASEAVASGSSQVEASAEHLRVTAGSIRPIFADATDESAFHSEWKAENQPIVDAAAPRLEAALVELAAGTGLALAPWSEALPEAWSWAEAGHAQSPEVVCAAGPCRLRLQAHGGWMMSVEVALERAPPREATAQLETCFEEALKALAEALAAPDPP